MTRRGLALLLASSLLFSITAVLARVLSRELHFFQIVALRFAVGLLGLLPVWLRGWRPDLRHPVLLFSRGAFGGLAVLLYFYAIETIPVAAATLLNYTHPIYAALFAAILLAERPTLQLGIGLGAATAGSALVALGAAEGFGRSLDGSSSMLWGGIAGMLSAVLGGGAVTSIRALRKGGVDTYSVFGAFCAAGLVTALPFAIPTWVPLRPLTLALVLAMGVSALFGQLLFTAAFDEVSAAMGAAVTQLTPVGTWLLSALLLDEHLSALATAGAALVVAGIAWGGALRVREARARLALPEAEG